MTDTLRIERLASTYLVPRDHPEPQRLRADMDEVARRHISECCARAMTAVMDPADPSVWVIDEVRLDLLLDVHSRSPEDIADFWARKIASTVRRVLADGADGVGVLRFADRAAFLAHFLRSLVENRAWESWYFAEFSALRSLPLGAGLREALLREPRQAERALLQLSARALKSVVEAWSRVDEELVVGCCADGASYSERALKRVLGLTRVASWTETRLTGWYFRIRAECPEMAPRDAAGAAENMVRIAQWSCGGELRGIVEACVQGRMPLLLPGSGDVEIVAMLRQIAVTGGASLVGSLLGDADRPGSEAGQSVEVFGTELGGVFLLAVVLAETRALWPVFGRPEDSGLRYLLYVVCLQQMMPSAWRDPALRLAAGLPAGLPAGLAELPDAAALAAIQLRDVPVSVREKALAADVDYFAACDAEVVPGVSIDEVTSASLAVCAAVLMREFAGRLPALAGSSVDYLWRNVLGGTGWVAVEEVITVHLEPRPLQIVLRMAGLHERVVEVPGGERAFVVRLDES